MLVFPKATAIERAIETNNMPRGVFSLLHGITPEIGADIVTRSQIKARTGTAQYVLLGRMQVVNVEVFSLLSLLAWCVFPCLCRL